MLFTHRYLVNLILLRTYLIIIKKLELIEEILHEYVRHIYEAWAPIDGWSPSLVTNQIILGCHYPELL